ncbi:DUF3172 domain-containing protein [Argonema antarcticum]|uniref:DUF3172 domain-containing protein n=1 Tax=Argonema antarcticum TaxID=2942763 RepID=UPI00201137EE|nr:DUF3172 domain-containing protein [Argonema antarcticum]MCL1471430.1 DUF3172 domain-containing protein [Argonema antarcticum A004/B2]
MKRKSTAASQSSAFNSTTLAILAGVFILGIGVGIGFSTTANSSIENVASREVIDRSAPNPDICAQYGASAIVSDTRIFVTLNPFTVYVTQPRMQPGCVLRSNNWAILESRKLVTSEQVRECKNRMNTFGYTNALENSPEIDCLYQTEADKNRFFNQPGTGAPPAETGKF